MHIWKDRPQRGYLGFLQSYTFSKDAAEVNRDNLTKYIRTTEQEEANCGRGTSSFLGEIRLWTRTDGPTDVIARRIMRSPTNEEFDRRVVESGRYRRLEEAAADRTGDDPDLGCLMLYAIDKALRRAQEDVLHVAR